MHRECGRDDAVALLLAFASPDELQVPGVAGKAPNATVIEGIDADGFYALLTERLARL